MAKAIERSISGLIFDVKRFASDDGPGIRTTVFLKGCPLRCVWCHSPESIGHTPELVFLERRCLRCGACAEVCPRDARRVSETERAVDRAVCDNCGECVAVCPSGALEMRGRLVAACDLVEDLVADATFYRQSGGGVTVSGGEPTAQAEFVRAVLAGCRERGIHTAMETNGFTGWAVLESLLPLVDLFLFDVKHMDGPEHERLTGRPNAPILRNLERLAAAGARVQVRLPLIPGLTDAAANVASTAAFVREVGLRNIALLPYNRAAGSKYLWLGRDYPLEHLETQSEEYLRSLEALCEAQGLRVQIGG